MACHKDCTDFGTRITHLYVPVITVITLTVRRENYKSLETKSQGLVFTERGGLYLEATGAKAVMGGTKLCLLLLLGSYTLARKYWLILESYRLKCSNVVLYRCERLSLGDCIYS